MKNSSLKVWCSSCLGAQHQGRRIYVSIKIARQFLLLNIYNFILRKTKSVWSWRRGQVVRTGDETAAWLCYLSTTCPAETESLPTNSLHIYPVPANLPYLHKKCKWIEWSKENETWPQSRDIVHAAPAQDTELASLNFASSTLCGWHGTTSESGKTTTLFTCPATVRVQ